MSKNSASRPDAAVTLRRCLGNFATGVAIVTYDGPDGPRGLTVNSFTSVSLDPPLVLICVGINSRAAGLLPGASFAVNFLHARQGECARHFAGRASLTFELEWRRESGSPLLADSLAWLACEPWSVHEAGDHLIVLGRVVEFGAGDEDPLCFFRGAFQQFPPLSMSPSRA
ncbi:hypothetical protein AC629_21410 [Bradyrhizobium sp. NAS80.1]|uniref:flavin reductase family protein n=1 Tax=Bradyrhizobium sp. NAS80.1 TaxID=1680159 RepID=UPI00095EA8E0|nr:flavin reductase family protein [Bradyrhizobium sp. NAS80.1]OKO84422.1 hypothetical protein AC629_21410 [Bradyrhizobium sp. NAS80.1]